MKLLRNIDNTLLDDPKVKLNFKRLTQVSELPEKFYKASWEDLHDLRSRAIKGLDHILIIADKEKRSLNEDENLAFEYGNALIDGINEDFEIRTERNTKEPVDLSNKFLKVPSEDAEARPKKLGKASDRSYRGMFHEGRKDMTLSKEGFETFNDFLTVMASGRFDERLEKRTFYEGTGASGGFTVPEEFSALLFDASLEEEIVRPRAQIWPMISDTRNIPAWDSSDHQTDGLFGGYTGEWLSEGVGATRQTGKVRNVKLTARKLACYTDASREVLQDGLSLEDQLQMALKKAISYFLDYAFLTGSGINRPLGVLNDPALITHNRAGASAVVYSDLVAMYSRLHPALLNEAVWVISHGVLPQLCNMLDTGNHLIWMPGNFQGGISSAVPSTIFGKPVIFTEKTPNLGSKGDVMLVAFSQYAVGLRQEIVLDKSNAPGWLTDTIDFRAIVRPDGTGLWNKPVTPLNGGNTLSWCVALDTP